MPLSEKIRSSATARQILRLHNRYIKNISSIAAAKPLYQNQNSDIIASIKILIYGFASQY